MPLDSTPDLNALETNKNIKSGIYWQQRLADFEPAEYLNDAAAWSSPAAGKIFDAYTTLAPETISRRLNSIAPSDKARHIILLSALGILLHRLSGKADIAVFSPVYREEGRQENSVIPVRMNHFANISFPGFVSILKDHFVRDLGHAGYPVEKILLKNKKKWTEQPVIGILTEEIHLPAAFEHTNADLICSFGISDGLALTVRYNTRKFGAEYIALLADRYLHLLGHLMDSGRSTLSDIDVLTDGERRQLLTEFNDTQAAYPSDKTIIDLVEAQMMRTPGNIALKCGNENISYKELDRRMNAIAAYLRQLDAGGEALVGIMLERGVELIPCILGVLKAGFAYVPIDPSYPAERIHTVITDAGIKILVTKAQLLAAPLPQTLKLVDPDDIPDTPPVQTTAPGGMAPAPASLAYVLYTSGSTGKPKGVMITHQSLVNYITWGADYYTAGRELTFALHTSVGFDLTVTSIFIPLITGGKVMVYKEDKDRLLIGRILADKEVDVIKLTPSHLSIIKELAGEWTRFSGRRKFIVGGEELPAQLARDVFHKFNGRVDIYNEYGPTEATVGCMIHPFDPAETLLSVPIGVPINNSRIYILDKDLLPVPIGVEGGIYIAGDGLAKGYLNSEQLTAERFVPAAHLGEQKLYRTGDRAVRTGSGQMLYRGREDDQVKINGFRIEPGEITYQLATHDEIKEAVVIPQTNNALDKFLVAYYLSDAEIPAVRLKAYLAARLPEYMVPLYYVRLAHMPLTSNGKLDKRSLPAFAHGETGDHMAPSNKTEEKLRQMWSEILKLDKERISLTKGFLELGGHSIKVVLLLNRILTEFNVEVPINEVFDNGSIKYLAEYIHAREQVAFSRIPAAPEKAYYPLSAAQKRLYLQYEFDKLSCGYNMPRVVKLEGHLDEGRLKNAFHQLIARHEVLRTSFRMINDMPVQQIVNHIDFEIEVFTATEEEAVPLIREFIRPFDLARAPLLRVGLIATGPWEHILMADMHHIITDGLSEDILIRDFMALYNNETLPALNIQYKDYAEWQQSADHQQEISHQKTFWQNEFAAEVTPLALPTDYPRPVSRNDEGRSESFELSGEEVSGLRQVAEGEGVTMFMLLLAIYNILLGKLGNQEDVVVGTPTAGREHPDLEHMMGMFVNTLPLRNFPSGEKEFRDFLSDVRQRTLNCFENQDYPFEEITGRLHPAGDNSRHPLFDVVFAYQNFGVTDFGIPGLKVKPFRREQTTAKFDMTLFVYDSGDRMVLEVEYATALFTAATIDRFVAFFRRILTTVVADVRVKIAAISMLSPEEERRILHEFNNTKTEYPADKTIADVFEAQADISPDAVALMEGIDSVTYRRLNDRANQLAHLLQQKGVKEGDCVGVWASRSMDAVIAMLAVLKAGAAYLPLDPAFPATRLDHMLRDANVKIVLYQSGCRHLPDYDALMVNIGSAGQAGPVVNPVRRTTPADLAYVIYTSGSTGVPKGVAVTNRNVMRLVKNTNYVSLGASTRILQTGAPVFDATTFEIWGSLLNGGTLCLADNDIILDAALLDEALQQYQINTLWLTSSLFDQHVRANTGLFRSLQYLLVGGDTLTPATINQVRALYPDLQIINGYGPTENTTFSVCHRINTTYETNIPIGKPVSNSTAYIVNRAGYLQPVGVPGELYVGGDGVARGYLNNGQLTAEKFIPDPFVPGGRLYKTGDIARWLPDGTIAFMGRADNQIKIRGFRIELEEIKHKLSRHPSVADAVVLAIANQNSKYLVAYYVASQEVDASLLRAFLADQLPDYMVPACYVPVPAIPLTPNGKVDRKALPAPLPVTTKVHMAPQTHEEKLLVAIWEEVLGVKNIGLTDDLFALGADSLKSIQIRLRIQAAGYDVSVRDILSCKTIQELSGKITADNAAANKGAIVGKAAVTPHQARFFRQQHTDRQLFSQSVLLHFAEGISTGAVTTIFKKILEQHDALCTVFKEVNGEMVQEHRGGDIPLSLEEKDMKSIPDPQPELAAACRRIQENIDPLKGPLMKLGLFHFRDGSRLLIAIHRLVIDESSWRTLLDDFDLLYQQVQKNEELSLPMKTDSFLSWSRYIQEYRKGRAFIKSKLYWDNISAQPATFVKRDKDGVGHPAGDSETASVLLDSATTSRLLTDVHHSFSTEINETLLTALLISLHRQCGEKTIKVDVETSGRIPVRREINTTRTIGWFSGHYPVVLTLSEHDLSATMAGVKQVLKKVPNNGMDYLIYKYQHQDGSADNAESAGDSRVCFRYQPPFFPDLAGKTYRISDEAVREVVSHGHDRDYDWIILAKVTGGQLQIGVTYSAGQYKASTIHRFLQWYKESLTSIVDDCFTSNKPA